MPTEFMEWKRVLIWQEDDARALDTEGLGEAWERIFGEKLEAQTSRVRHDGGDAVYVLHSSNRIACASYAGENAIYQALPPRKF